MSGARKNDRFFLLGQRSIFRGSFARSEGIRFRFWRFALWSSWNEDGWKRMEWTHANRADEMAVWGYFPQLNLRIDGEIDGPRHPNSKGKTRRLQNCR